MEREMSPATEPPRRVIGVQRFAKEWASLSPKDLESELGRAEDAPTPIP